MRVWVCLREKTAAGRQEPEGVEEVDVEKEAVGREMEGTVRETEMGEEGRSLPQPVGWAELRVLSPLAISPGPCFMI